MISSRSCECGCAGAAAARAASRMAEESRISTSRASAGRGSQSAGAGKASPHATASPTTKPSPVCSGLCPLMYCLHQFEDDVTVEGEALFFFL